MVAICTTNNFVPPHSPSYYCCTEHLLDFEAILQKDVWFHRAAVELTQANIGDDHAEYCRLEATLFIYEDVLRCLENKLLDIRLCICENYGILSTAIRKDVLEGVEESIITEVLRASVASARGDGASRLKEGNTVQKLGY